MKTKCQPPQFQPPQPDTPPAVPHPALKTPPPARRGPEPHAPPWFYYPCQDPSQAAWVLTMACGRVTRVTGEKEKGGC